MTLTTAIRATQLKVGDIVWTHGMRVKLHTQLPTYPRPGERPVVAFKGTVTNSEEVRTALGNIEEWTVQGNDLRLVDVELEEE